MRNTLQRVQQLREQLESLHRTTATVLEESKRLLDAMEAETSNAPRKPQRGRPSGKRPPRSARS